MTIRRTLVAEPLNKPSRQQINRKIRQSKTIEGFVIRPGFVYTVVRAISARVNQNYDGWPSDELKKAAHTFVGKPVFVNHTNDNPETARGVVVAARYVENGHDRYVECVQEIDAQRYPKIAKEIVTGGMDSVSMGAEAGFTICSFCGNKAVEEEDLCDHVKYSKGEHLRKHNSRTGKVEDVLIYESCHKLNFFELSYVFDPADETAVASKVLVGSKKIATDCPPGRICDTPTEERSGPIPGMPKPEDMGKDLPTPQTPELPKTPGTGSSGGGGKPNDSGILPQSQGLYDSIKKDNPDLDIGGYREDSYGEHANGALDVMTSDPAQAAQVRQKAFDAGAPYVLWQQQQWNADGTTSPMEDRGDPTQNHMDHVHTAPIPGKTGSFEKAVLKMAGFDRQAYGEIEAPPAVDTLREEGSAPEDDTDDFHRYVSPPPEMQMPDLSQASQLDRDQEEADQGQENVPAPPGQEPAAQQFIELKVPLPPQNQMPGPPQPQAPPTPPGQPPAQQPPQVPMQSFSARAASVEELAYFENYYGRRIANWRDAIEAGRPLTPEEGADYQRARLEFVTASTLENTRTGSTTSRTPRKGNADMGRSILAERGRTASKGRRHHADGPLVDTGDEHRNDQGEQEEAFITQTPPEEHAEMPADDEQNISNTENNLVARVQRGREQLLRDAQALARYKARTAGVDGDADQVVNPTVPDPDSERLTGDHFEPLEEAPKPTNPHDASLKVFQAFDQWLTKATGTPSRGHTEASIKRHAATFANRAQINPQVMFPALGIVLREARKQQKGAGMQRRADEKLEIAAPDERVDVEAPVADTTDAEAQASQFDTSDFGNNAGDDIAKPDLSTDSQVWAPGEGKKTSNRAKTAGGLLAMRCAEAYIDAGLEPDTRERKYQLAAEFQNMNRGTVLDRVALTERFAAVLANERSRNRKVASGGSRGAAKSPVPPGLAQGVSRVASRKVATNDPTNDSLLFG